MNLILCLDDKNGMQFNKRRQSTDRELQKHILLFAGKAVLWMSPYSASQFSVLPDSVKVAGSFLTLASEEDYCFVENEDWVRYAADIREIIVYRWNRVYPADLWFPESELTRRRLVSRSEFAGFSHARITQEVYCL